MDPAPVAGPEMPPALPAVVPLVAYAVEQRAAAQERPGALEQDRGVPAAAPAPAGGAPDATATTGAGAPAIASADATTPATGGGATARMRAYWEEQIAGGRIPTGTELARAAGCSPQYGRKMRAAWEQTLSPEVHAQLRRAVA